MKYQLKSGALHPIHLLRYLMRVKRTTSVLDRTWEFKYLCSDIHVEHGVNRERWVEIFPEFEDKTPFRVDGMRLVERVALALEFEETELVRLSDDAPNGYDLWILADSGELRVETDDEEMYLKMKEYFDRTADLAYRGFFF